MWASGNICCAAGVTNQHKNREQKNQHWIRRIKHFFLIFNLLFIYFFKKYFNSSKIFKQWKERKLWSNQQNSLRWEESKSIKFEKMQILINYLFIIKMIFCILKNIESDPESGK